MSSGIKVGSGVVVEAVAIAARMSSGRRLSVFIPHASPSSVTACDAALAIDAARNAKAVISSGVCPDTSISSNRESIMLFGVPPSYASKHWATKAIATSVCFIRSTGISITPDTTRNRYGSVRNREGKEPAGRAARGFRRYLLDPALQLIPACCYDP